MKKVLSFVLILALVLSSFSMAFAGTEAQTALTDISGNANEEAITVNYNLGIIAGMGNGTFQPDSLVNRAQFAKMITAALAIPESALAGYTKVSFKDMAGYGWAVPYLAFCESKGIMTGYGDGTARPGQTVTANEAMAMVLRALGYTNNSAALTGTWPSNYVSLAQNNGLYDDVTASTGVDRGDAAQIIYNALSVDKVEVAADGTTKVLSDRSSKTESQWKIVNMLTTGLSCTSEMKTVNGTESTLINLKPYIGKYCTVYKKDSKPYEIVAVASEESTTIKGDFDGAVSVSKGALVLGTFEFTGNDDSEYTIADGLTVAALYVNGDEIGTNTTAYNIAKDHDVTLNVDLSGKKVTEIYSVTDWNVTKGDKISKSQINSIKDNSIYGFDFETLKDGKIDATSYTLDGVASLDKIAEDNIVYVYADKNQKIAKVEVGTKVVEGKVTKVKSDKYTVGGNEYEIATDVIGHTTDKPKLGDEVKLYLDFSGDIYKFDTTSGKADKYAVKLANDTTYDKVKLYTSTDEKKWFETDLDDGNNISDTAVDKLVAYSLNNKGEVDTLTSGGTTMSALLNDKEGTKTITGSATLLSTSLIKLGDGTTTKSLNVDKDCTVFVIKGTDYDRVTTIANVDTNKDLTSGGALNVQVYVNSDGDVAAMLVYDVNAKNGTDDIYAAISEVSGVTNAAGDEVQQVIGFADGAKLDKLTDDKNVAAAAAGVTTPALYKIKYNAEGLVTEVVKAGVVTGTTAQPNMTLTNITVTAIANDGKTLTLSDTNIYGLAKDVIVYKVVMDKDGEVDYYQLSDAGSISEGNWVQLYNTEDDEDSAGYEVAIYWTKEKK